MTSLKIRLVPSFRSVVNELARKIVMLAISIGGGILAGVLFGVTLFSGLQIELFAGFGAIVGAILGYVIITALLVPREQKQSHP